MIRFGTIFYLIFCSCLCLAQTQANAASESSTVADEELKHLLSLTLKDLSSVIVVTAPNEAFANNETSEFMLQQQSDIASVNTVIGNLPGVLVNEGGVYGFDDWSTTIFIRGFQNSLAIQQIGTTIDGIPNGNSNYSGGAKANRFIDIQNLKGVKIWQGSADIASRSYEALGGTLDFMTQDPEYEERYRISTSVGQDEARKIYLRYDTGEFMDDTRAWVSVSHAESTDWINQSAENDRQHVATKIISEFENIKLTGYISYEEVLEHNYQRITLDQFEANPDWDRLTADWTGLPWVDQVYRKAWSTIRDNLFTYLRADFDQGDVKLKASGYYHYNDGFGGFAPPYIVDVRDDGAGGNSELSLNPVTVESLDSFGRIQFVDANGIALSPTPGCVSSITFPYGGAGPEYDPACYSAGAIPVSTIRHTNYHKERIGFIGDVEWVKNIGNYENTLRSGIWYEYYKREESRDWHKIIDSEVGPEFVHNPYWSQFDWEADVDTFSYYIEDSLDFGPLLASIGVRQFFVDLEQEDKFNGDIVSVGSDSDLLLSGGLIIRTPVEGLELFGGYAENFAAIKDTVLERRGADLQDIEPETSTAIDIGLRYFGKRIGGAITFYNIEFDSSITKIAADSPAGISFLLPSTTFLNAGGFESEGVEVFANYLASEAITLYLSYTHNQSRYLGSGNELIDQSIGVTPGNTVFGSVENMFVLSGNWSISNHHDLGVSTKFVDERWLDPENTQRIDDYIVTDFYLAMNGGALSESLRSVNMRLTVNNVTDERYIGGVSEGWGGWIGGARAAVLSITMDI